MSVCESGMHDRWFHLRPLESPYRSHDSSLHCVWSLNWRFSSSNTPSNTSGLRYYFVLPKLLVESACLSHLGRWMHSRNKNQFEKKKKDNMAFKINRKYNIWIMIHLGLKLILSIHLLKRSLFFNFLFLHLNLLIFYLYIYIYIDFLMVFYFIFNFEKKKLRLNTKLSSNW